MKTLKLTNTVCIPTFALYRISLEHLINENKSLGIKLFEFFAKNLKISLEVFQVVQILSLMLSLFASKEVLINSDFYANFIKWQNGR